eukprot:13062877-Ditylum_brightwellii.AAC.1
MEGTQGYMMSKKFVLDQANIVVFLASNRPHLMEVKAIASYRTYKLPKIENLVKLELKSQTLALNLSAFASYWWFRSPKSSVKSPMP